MSKIIENIIDTIKYNCGIVPEKELYIEDHIDNGNLNIVKKLIKENNELIGWKDDFGNSLLHIAVHEKLVEIATFLIQAGCDVNAQDNNGETPLHVAVTFPDTDIIKLLINNSADANIKDNTGDTPLSLADNDIRKNINKIIELEDACNQLSAPLHADT
jgi:ankyrin repeat protein